VPSFLLLVSGTIITGYALWQLKQWVRQMQEASLSAPHRLEAIVEELVLTAEVASAAVAEKTEQLDAALASVDERLAKLQTAAVAARAAADGLPVSRPRPRPAQRLPVSTRVSPSAPEPVELTLPAPSLRPLDLQPAMPELHRRVYRLADAGSDVTTIARQLSVTKGEIQLILNLRRV
jgi:transposase-like protein